MRARSGRQPCSDYRKLDALRAVGLAAALLSGAGAGCKPADAPNLERCGNGVVELDAGEDCEPRGDSESCGAEGTGATACRWLCVEGECPDGYRCGRDEICRRPCLGHEGEPACEGGAIETLSTVLSTAEIAWLSVQDVVGDEYPEIVAVELEGTTMPGDGGLEAVVRVYQHSGDAIVMGSSAPTGDFPLLTRLDPDGPVYLIAQRSALPTPPAAPDAIQMESIISVLEPDLGFREVLIQGPTTVDPGPLSLVSWTRPADLPAGTDFFLFGFGDGTVWEPAPSGVDLAAPGHPDDLLGPDFGQPIEAMVAADGGFLASQHCEAMIYAYRNATDFHTNNLCDGIAAGWTSVALVFPTLPQGTTLGGGLVIADANADSLSDIIVTTSADRIHTAYAVGDGTFHSDAASLPASDGDGDFDGGVGFVDAAEVDVGVIGAGDFNGDGLPDFITRSAWIRSCAAAGCGTCDVPSYRCDIGTDLAPGYIATPQSLVDRDGDGEMELAVLARTAGDAFFPPESWGPVPPGAGDLVVIRNPVSPTWSRSVIDMPGAPDLLSSGDIDGDSQAELVLRLAHEDGDELIVVFADDAVERVGDFERIVAAHVEHEQQTLAVVSEDLDGAHRRLTLLSATLDHELRSTAKLGLGVVPRQFIAGRFDTANVGEMGLAVLGEDTVPEMAVELLTRGDGSFFDSSTRRATKTSLALAAEHALRTRGVALDLNSDGVDELVVFAPDGLVRTLSVASGDAGPSFSGPEVASVAERYAGPVWPGHGDPDSLGSSPIMRDLDGDGSPDIWLLTSEHTPRMVAFRNLGNRSIDVEGRAVSLYPDPQLSACDGDAAECAVRIGSFAAFDAGSDRSESIASTAVDLVLVDRRALFHWTLDPFDPDTARELDLDELAVVKGNREPLGPIGAGVLGAIGDVDGDGIDDVIAAGHTGIRWLRGLAVNP